MATKQNLGSQAPDGSMYVTIADGAGNLTPGLASGSALPAGSNVVGKVGIDQTTDGTTNLVASKQSGTWTIQPGNTANTTPWVVDQTKQSSLIAVPVSYAFQRPADTTAYAVGDLIANSTTAGSVVIPNVTGVTIAGGAGSGEVASVSIFSSNGLGSIRAHMYHTTAPTVSNGDNGAALVTNSSIDNYIGYVDITLAGTIHSNGPIGTAQCNLPYKMASGDKIYLVFEALSAFTPGNAAFYNAIVRVRRYS